MNAKSRPVVLAVEDDADGRDMLCTWLDCCGFLPVAASDAATALAKIEERVPDAILLDIGLPDVDGCEVARRVRANKAAKSTPIVALTGHAFPADVQRAKDAGCNAVLIKPCDPAKVLLELQRQLPTFFKPAGA